jgi:hypothetical protein
MAYKTGLQLLATSPQDVLLNYEMGIIQVNLSQLEVVVTAIMLSLSVSGL